MNDDENNELIFLNPDDFKPMGRRLVVLASGWTDVDALWWPMARKLEAIGYDTLRTTMPRRGFGPIEDSALAIGSVLLDISPSYESIIWVGHSMGGLIGRFLVQELESDFIKGYVSLGTPHGGTHMASLAPWSESAQQMKIGSKFMKNLNSTPWPEKIPALALQASFDEAVRPRKRSKMRGAKNIVIPKTTHTTLPLSDIAYSTIVQWMLFDVFGDECVIVNELGHSSKLKLS